MYTEIRKAVLHCAHCRIANSTSHQDQQILGALSTDEPFDILCMDVWHPGKTHQKTDTFQRAVLTCLCNLTGFVSLAFLTRIDSELVTHIAFSHFFCPNGLPKMVILDGGSEFKGMLVEVCEALGVQYHVVAPENHNAILCKRFHRYMNKVQRLGAADMQSFEQWKINALFAGYAWNASPIDGTDIICSFAAKARTFRFPLDVQETGKVARIPQEGELAIQHVETMFPLWYLQKELL
jgi:hypothetical protein